MNTLYINSNFVSSIDFKDTDMIYKEQLKQELKNKFDDSKLEDFFHFFFRCEDFDLVTEISFATSFVMEHSLWRNI